MAMSDATARIVGRSVWIAAWAGVVLSPIHALSRYATMDGAEDLDLPFVRAWAEPAARALKPLLSWSDPQTVYVTYGRIWLFLAAAATLGAITVRQRRGTVVGVEKVGWWIALAGYVLVTLSLVGDYWTPWLDESFLFLGIPGMLTSLIGSLVLGIGLLRRNFRPKATGWLLVAWIPLFILLSNLIALGAALLPMLWAWGLAGRSVDRTLAAPERASAPEASLTT